MNMLLNTIQQEKRRIDYMLTRYQETLSKLPKGTISEKQVKGGILMDKQKFKSMLMLLVPQVIYLITKNYSYDEVTASREFYDSKVYSILEQEDTKLWHLSALTLFNMFDEEKQTGTFTFPEEA